MSSSGADDLFDRVADALRRTEASPLSRYEILGELGRGGISVVYRAKDSSLGREVALKVLQPHLETAPEARLRFQRECQAAARLRHPHLVTAYDAGEDEGRLYLVMERVDGLPLHRILERHRSELKPMLELIEKVARAVHHAHEAGVVHRDLKPSNILVTAGNEPKVTDFGLAHLLAQPSTALTQGAVVGTPLYMAPEQATAGSITPRTDVYALGAILYEMAAGRPPHTGANVAEILAKVCGEDPEPLRSGPAEVGVIALKALEKEPARRYDSALAFAEDVRRFLDHRPILAHSPGAWMRSTKWVRRHRATSVILASILLGAALLGGNQLRFRWKLAEILSRAEAAERAGNPGGAADLYSEVRSLRPGHPTAERKVVEMRQAERRVRAAGFVARARRQQTLYRETTLEVAAAAQGVQELAQRIPRHQTDKTELWNQERTLEAARRKAAMLYSDVVAALLSALGLDPENREAKRGLAEVYFAEFERCERENEFAGMETFGSLVRIYDDGTFAPRLASTGEVSIESAPAGVSVETFRFEEGPDRRLVLRPEARLSAGSYLFLLRKSGYADVRVAVLVRREGRHALKIKLYAPDEIGSGFVYIPSGSFVLGGDPEAFQGAERSEAETNDFFIGRFEVTFAEYREFVVASGGRHLPRDPTGMGELWKFADGRVVYRQEEMRDDWPILGVSWEDATAYCRWRTAQARARGERVTVRLPTHLEWEKAARGVDGRSFPWGHHFDWTFTRGEFSRPGPSKIEPVGIFEKDESPYGVRDMAGSMREWCEDWYDPGKTLKHQRGGAWCYTHVTAFRCASRNWRGTGWVNADTGFRVVRVPDR